MDNQTINRKTTELQFNVAQLLKQGVGNFREYEIVTAPFKYLNEQVEVIAPVEGSVKMLSTGQNILVTGFLQTMVRKSCGRCLNEFTTPVKIELEEGFFPTIDILTGSGLEPPDGADEANRISEQHILDLVEVARQELLMESDTILYCRPNCKGLCPQCGEDRNSHACSCSTEIIDSRWAGLLNIKIEE